MMESEQAFNHNHHFNQHLFKISTVERICNLSDI